VHFEISELEDTYKRQSGVVGGGNGCTDCVALNKNTTLVSLYFYPDIFASENKETNYL
jgi:hypothetical protein